VDPDRGDLARRMLEPDPGKTVDPRRLDSARSEGDDQRLLEIAAVLLDVLPVPRQVEDRIADELPRAMVGRLAAAVGLDDLDTCILRNVQLARFRAPAQRHDRRVLEQED